MGRKYKTHFHILNQYFEGWCVAMRFLLKDMNLLWNLLLRQFIKTWSSGGSTYFFQIQGTIQITCIYFRGDGVA